MAPFHKKITSETLIRYALSQNITVAIVGCSTRGHVRTLARMGRDFKPISLEDQDALVNWFHPQILRFAHYRGVIKSPELLGAYHILTY